MIKPGMLCWIVDHGLRPDWNGKVVIAVKYLPACDVSLTAGDFPLLPALPVWVIESGWMGPTAVRWVCKAEWLRPISDPDIDTTEKDDALADNLLDVLAQAHQPEAA